LELKAKMALRKSNRISVFKDRAIEQSLREAAEIGVPILQKHHGRLDKIENKGAIDLVTKADRESEEKVFKYLRRRHPDHVLVGEESWVKGSPPPSGFAWILDPLDGTTNYAHGLDHYAFSLGLTYDGEPVAGIVVDPHRDHTYTAFKGRGAFRNRKQIHVSSKTKLADCLMATGFPYNRREIWSKIAPTLEAFIMRTHGIRRFGVASLDLAFVAAGQFDGYYEPTLHAWDVAAGILLVTEAGGKVTDYRGEPVNLFNPSIVSANPKIHRAMLKVIQESLKDHGIPERT